MQYFIGIPLPDDIKEKIVSFQESFANNKVHLMVEPHITVKAQGGLIEDKFWIPAIENAIKEYPAFEVSFADVGNFGERVAFLVPSSGKELMGLHRILVNVIKPSAELMEKYFEGDNYHFHLTLAGTSWGMTSEELMLVKEKAKIELLNLQKFRVSFIRVYEQKDHDGPYEKLLDIPLKK